MSRSVYDTRFFIEHFYSSDDRVLRNRSIVQTRDANEPHMRIIYLENKDAEFPLSIL